VIWANEVGLRQRLVRLQLFQCRLGLRQRRVRLRDLLVEFRCFDLGQLLASDAVA
jgi:hypothetical protein